jgi:hypothetical protein
VFSLNDKRAMNQGFGDGMSRAFEIVATPLLFGGLGHLVDRLVGTTPVFVVALGLFGVIGTFVRLWYGYDTEMRAHETGGSWVRREADAVPDEADTARDLWSERRRAAS